MPFTQVAVTFTFKVGGVAQRGEVVAALSNDMVDGVGIVCPAGPRPSVKLDANGHGSITLDANDDPTTELPGASYLFTFYLAGLPMQQATYLISHTAPGGTIDLAQLIPQPPANPQFPYALASGLAAEAAARALADTATLASATGRALVFAAVLGP